MVDMLIRLLVLRPETTDDAKSLVQFSYERGLILLACGSFGNVIRVLAPCRGHETISIVGPKEYIEPAMQNLKLDYELVDWESRYRSMLDERELKKYLKALEKEEKAKAKAEAEAANAG